MRAERGLYLPEPGSPHWIGPAPRPCDLLYLAWGRRYYGRHPIPVRLHHGWSYLAVVQGTPTLIAGSRRIETKPGTVIMAGPDVPYGWEDRRNRRSALLVWVWGPTPGAGLPAKKNTCRIRSVGADELETLEELHALTRREIQSPDGLSPGVLASVRTLVESAFARQDRPRGWAQARDQRRMQLADEWIDRHLHLQSMGGALADYLGLPPASLHRLFRRFRGAPPAKAFFERKMREARRLLAAKDLNVKQVGLQLGYKHPGDFTRAFTRFHGCAPSRLDALVLCAADRA